MQRETILLPHTALEGISFSLANNHEATDGPALTRRISAFQIGQMAPNRYSFGVEVALDSTSTANIVIPYSVLQRILYSHTRVESESGEHYNYLMDAQDVDNGNGPSGSLRVLGVHIKLSYCVTSKVDYARNDTAMIESDIYGHMDEGDVWYGKTTGMTVGGYTGRGAYPLSPSRDWTQANDGREYVELSLYNTIRDHMIDLPVLVPVGVYSNILSGGQWSEPGMDNIEIVLGLPENQYLSYNEVFVSGYADISLATAWVSPGV